METAIEILEFISRKILSVLLSAALLGVVVTQVFHLDEIFDVFLYAAGACFVVLFVSIFLTTYIRTKYLQDTASNPQGSEDTDRQD
jgi:hypothetical protein